MAADSLRYSLVAGLSMGMDLKYDEEKAKQAKLFLNKLYNAGKYVLHVAANESLDPEQFILENKSRLTICDKWIINSINKLSREICKNLEKFELGMLQSINLLPLFGMFFVTGILKFQKFK